jgi:hypothetical protein
VKRLWGVIDNREENGQIHTVPMWQRRRHDLTMQCDCIPEIEPSEDGDLVNHQVIKKTEKADA